MKSKLFISLILTTIMILMYGGCSEPSIGKSQFIFENIFIERIKSSDGDRQRIRQLQLNTSDSSIYIVKIQAQLPPPTGSALHVYLGDTEIEQYGPYTNGIYFKVYSEETLNILLGKELSYSIDRDETRHLTGIIVPNSDQIKNKDSAYELLPDLLKCFQEDE